MRMRFKPYARPELAAWPYCVASPPEHRGHWKAAFKDPGLPLHMEFGCGKGRFLALHGVAEPGCNHLGIDIKSEMLVVAKRTAERLYAEAGRALDNLLIASWELEAMDRIFSPVDMTPRIYINFCNPWCKSGHAKHRLTHPRQLVKMRSFLAPQGEIWFKTDDTQLFNASLRYFAATGFELTWLCRDLHAAEPGWNIRTEHEEMFASQGIPIKACIAQMRVAQLDVAAILKLKNI